MIYLRSDSFRKFLSAEVSRATKVRGEFSVFKWDGLAVETDSFVAEGDGLITGLRAEGLHTEVGMGGIWRGIWEIRESSLQRLELTVDVAKPQEKLATLPRKDAKATPRKPAWLPSKAEMQGLEITSVSLNAQLPTGPAMAHGMMVKVQPSGPKDAYRADVCGGTLQLPIKNLPALELQHVQLRYQDRQLFITEAKMGLWEKGSIEATGEWDMKLRQYSLEGTASGISCEEVLSKDWSKRLQGDLHTTFILEQGAGEATARGKLTVENATLTALPILDALAAYADTRRFRILALNEAHTQWLWKKGELTLTDLVISSEGLVRLEGQLTLRGEALDGTFRLGLAPGTLATIPGAETDVFTPGERGLRWAPLRITGTLQHPKEDLTDRLIAAAGLRIFEQIPETGEKVIKFTRSILPEAQSKVVDRALEKGVEFLEENRDVIREASGILGGLLGGKKPAPMAPPPAEER